MVVIEAVTVRLRSCLRIAHPVTFILVVIAGT
jgi:hypothetical protein